MGFSKRKRTTCFCLLRWDAQGSNLTFRLTSTEVAEREAVAQGLLGGIGLLGVAIDGPLSSGLRLVEGYRAAEALLSRGDFGKRCKPGQTSSPTGQQLHRHATQLSRIVLECGRIAAATRADAIHPRRIVEAFPNAFLAVLTPEREIPSLRRDASDRYWEILTSEQDRLSPLVTGLLPADCPFPPMSSIVDHEERAASVWLLPRSASPRVDS